MTLRDTTSCTIAKAEDDTGVCVICMAGIGAGVCAAVVVAVVTVGCIVKKRSTKLNAQNPTAVSNIHHRGPEQQVSTMDPQTVSPYDEARVVSGAGNDDTGYVTLHQKLGQRLVALGGSESTYDHALPQMLDGEYHELRREKKRVVVVDNIYDHADVSN
ncbi:uncharacterized protein [Littorina saxatilis]|uniref:uncharacterized protein isoform X2 n=1 Tax=Littorina saxatilis TaxID=31220 RepID=UPI0038B631DB